MRSFPTRLATLAIALSIGSVSAFAEIAPVAVSDESAGVGVVVSIAISAGILQPDEFPVAGRDCDALLSQLRADETFAGKIRGSYEPATDSGRCFNLEGKQAQVAVVCCAPRGEE